MAPDEPCDTAAPTAIPTSPAAKPRIWDKCTHAELVAIIEDLERQLRQRTIDWEHAATTVARMHSAALGGEGRFVGPRRGLVEDVEDLKLKYERLRRGVIELLLA